ncbi:MAG: hypothetical protein LUD47_06115 [Clostridia bacterium]|nr:hypothetical protein [Clostridia bacterium]
MASSNAKVKGGAATGKSNNTRNNKNDKNAKSKLVGENLADYERTHVPKGRWGDTWDLVKTCFVKLIIINLFVLLFCVPSIILMFVASGYTTGLGTIYPFSGNVGMGVFSYPDVVGLEQSVHLTSDLMFYSLLALSSLIASVGFSGALYSIRRLINTHGDFTVKGFFRGVKMCYLNTAIPFLIFMLFFFGSVVIKDWAQYQVAIGGNKGGAITAEVFMIIATVVVGYVMAWIMAVGVSFKAKPRYLIKNSMVLLGGTIISSIFMGIFALIPVWLFWWGLYTRVVKWIAYIIFIFIGFSYVFLVWMAFAQWAFDNYVNPVIKAEKEAEDAKKTPKQLEEEAAEERKKLALELLAAGRSDLIGRPIMPIAQERSVTPLGAAYSRESLKRVQEERQKIITDVNEYADAHINEPKYAEYNKLFAERDKVVTAPSNGKKGKKEKKNKISSDNLLG